MGSMTRDPGWQALRGGSSIALADGQTSPFADWWTPP